MRTLILAGLLAAAAATAQAQDAGVRELNRQDVRCVIGMSVMARNEQYKQWGTFGVFYFSGRIEGRDPGFSLADAIKREVRAMRPVEYNDEIKRCGDLLGERSRALDAMKPPAPRGAGR